jgi:hypothetical protein
VGFFLQFSSSERTAMLARGEPLATQLITRLPSLRAMMRNPVVLVAARVPPQLTWRKLSRRFCLGHNVVPPIYNGDRGRRSVGQGDARGGRSVGAG